MKNYILIALIFLGMSLKSYSQQNTPKTAFLEKWNNSSTYLLTMAESIPEESYNYKPTERQMSVAEQLLHIRKNMLWLGSTYFNQNGVEVNTTEPKPANKAQVIRALKEAFGTVEQLVASSNEEMLTGEVEFFAGPKSRLQILNLLQDHVTHHRGQLIVYMNLLDLEPPRYSGW